LAKIIRNEFGDHQFWENKTMVIAIYEFLLITGTYKEDGNGQNIDLTSWFALLIMVRWEHN